MASRCARSKPPRTTVKRTKRPATRRPAPGTAITPVTSKPTTLNNRLRPGQTPDAEVAEMMVAGERKRRHPKGETTNARLHH